MVQIRGEKFRKTEDRHRGWWHAHKNKMLPLPGVEPGMVEYSIAMCYSGWCSFGDKINYLTIKSGPIKLVGPPGPLKNMCSDDQKC